MIIDALLYPLRGGGWMMVLFGAIMMVLLAVASLAPILGLIALLIGGGYFAAFYFSVVATTVSGQSSCPDWPEVSNLWESILLPCLRMLGALVISYLPAIALVAFLGERPSGQEAILWAVRVWAWLYFPMAVLALVLFGHLGAALPHRVLPAIIRAMPAYLVAAIALLLAEVCGDILALLLVGIPYLGVFLSAAVTLYFLLVQGRLTGLAYVNSRARIAWD